MTFKDDMQQISKMVAKDKAEVFFEHVAKEKILEATQKGLTEIKIIREKENFENVMTSAYFKEHLEKITGMRIEINEIIVDIIFIECTIGVSIVFDWSDSEWVIDMQE